MPSESVTRIGLIRTRIISGKLPRAQKHEILGGTGDGRPCACCDSPIISVQMLYSVEVSDGQSLSMHLYCYDNWRQESLSLQKTQLL
jgi:hypothetical protein